MFYETLGKHLRMNRKKSKMSQEELGKIIHKGKACVSKYEKGLSGIDLETYIDICHALAIDPAMLITSIIEDTYQENEANFNAVTAQKLYACCYDASSKRFVRSVIEIDKTGIPYAAVLHSDVHNYHNYESSGNTYIGKLFLNENLFNFSFHNRFHSAEYGHISAMAPISRSSYYLGIMVGLSSLPIVPRADKIYISENIPVEDDELIAKLTFSKENLKAIQRSNRITPW